MSKSPDMSGQNDAARLNAEIAKEVWAQYQRIYMPKEEGYVNEAFNYDNPERRNIEAGKASADVEQAFGSTMSAQTRAMEAQGISPDQGAFASTNARLMRNKIGMQAGAQNEARQRVEAEGWKRKTGAISLGKGLPAQASDASSAAGRGYANVANTQMNQNQQDSNNMAGIAGGTIAAGSMIANPGAYWADGGYVDRKKVQHLAMGGPAGLQHILNNSTNQPQMVQPQPNQTLQSGIQGAQMARNGMKLGKMMYDKFGAPTQTPGIGAGNGAADLDAAAVASEQAAAPADALAAGASPMGIEAGAGAVGAESALAAETGATAAATAAETAAAATAAGTEAAALGGLAATGVGAPVAALVGAGLLASRLMASGGRVEGEEGGKVDGPGGPTDDKIPAWLSDGEYVINAEAVKHFGIDKFEKMNKVGLAKRYGIHGSR
jgi:hypothetical protein